MVQPLHVIESVKNVKHRKNIGKLCTSQLNALFADRGGGRLTCHQQLRG